MNEFKFWDKYMYLEEEELKLFNFVLQFDFGNGNKEYSCEDSALPAGKLPGDTDNPPRVHHTGGPFPFAEATRE